jgi:hypothetical protein
VYPVNTTGTDTEEKTVSKSFKDSFYDEETKTRDRKREKEDWKAARRAKAERRNFEQGSEKDY